MSDTALNNFQFYESKSSSFSRKALFLLHGTGGDETDLVPLIEPMRAEYSVVGLKGNISENGMARFFKRTSFGVFDQESIKTEAAKLKEFVTVWAEQNQVKIKDITWIGYSNGANMILALAFLFPEVVFRAVLLHAMLPFEPKELELSHAQFLLTYGELDPLISTQDSQKVVEVLTSLGADVKSFFHPGGHELRAEEVGALHDFLA
jgi:phospholipase/carboxylesterase